MVKGSIVGSIYIQDIKREVRDKYKEVIVRKLQKKVVWQNFFLNIGEGKING